MLRDIYWVIFSLPTLGLIYYDLFLNINIDYLVEKTFPILGNNSEMRQENMWDKFRVRCREVNTTDAPVRISSSQKLTKFLDEKPKMSSCSRIAPGYRPLGGGGVPPQGCFWRTKGLENQGAFSPGSRVWRKQHRIWAWTREDSSPASTQTELPTWENHSSLISGLGIILSMEYNCYED